LHLLPFPPSSLRTRSLGTGGRGGWVSMLYQLIYALFMLIPTQCGCCQSPLESSTAARQNSRKVASVRIGCIHGTIVYSQQYSLDRTARLVDARSTQEFRTSLANGADPNAAYGTLDDTCPLLLMAIGLRPQNSVRALVESGADVNPHRTTDGMTPLIFAAYDPKSNNLLYLLKHGARPNKADYRGQTPLMVAVESNNISEFGPCYGSALTLVKKTKGVSPP